MKKYTDPVFEVFGFSKEFYQDGKLIGSIRMDNPDREIMGYMGRTNEKLPMSVSLDNKKSIKAGSLVMTQLIPLCGKLLIPFW